jgi:hypothetical protein
MIFQTIIAAFATHAKRQHRVLTDAPGLTRQNLGESPEGESKGRFEPFKPGAIRSFWQNDRWQNDFLNPNHSAIHHFASSREARPFFRCP